jgi:ElaB/YqjD/DUF883 family membrane-anchored ribosome-binding protein
MVNPADCQSTFLEDCGDYQLSNYLQLSTQKDTLMDSSNNFAKTSQAIANKAADKVQAGIADTQHAAKEAGSSLSAKVDELRSDAAPVLKEAVGRAQAMGKQSISAVGDAASNATDTIIAYTRDNPVQALMIAAASGALLMALIQMRIPSRD